MHADVAVARVASGQHSLITRDELGEAGLTRGAIAHRVKRGRLHRVHQCVFSLAPPPLTLLARFMAAVLAYAPRSLLSHRSATVLWEVTEKQRGDIDVTVVGRKVKKRPGIRPHHIPQLAKADLTFRHGIPVTSLPRTLVDFAEQATPAELERALNEARVLHRVTDGQLTGAIQRAGHRHGAARLKALLQKERGPGVTRKEMERLFLNLIRRAGLPLPETNAEVLGRQADFYWPEHHVIVETDGWQAHSTRAAFETDRRKDQQRQAAGYKTLRFTYRQITKEPEATIATLAATLSRSSSTE